MSAGQTFTTLPAGNWSTSVDWVDVSVEDFNGDGRGDIVGRVAAWGQWWVSQSTTPQGSFSPSMNTLPWGSWSASVQWVDVEVGDFNKYAYEGLMNVTTIYQSHEGAINTSTSPKVEFGYDTTLSGGGSGDVYEYGDRRNQVTYLDGRVVFYDFDTANPDYPFSKFSTGFPAAHGAGSSCVGLRPSLK